MRTKETKPLTPSSFLHRKWLRKSSVLVIALGVAAAVFGAATKIDRTMTVDAMLHAPLTVAALTLVFLLYSSYFTLVVDQGLLRTDIGSLSTMGSVMPFLLLGAYLTMPLEVWLAGSPTTLSIVAFIVVYALWFFGAALNLGTRRTAGLSPNAKPDRVLWTLLDLMSLIALGVDWYLKWRSPPSAHDANALGAPGTLTIWGVGFRFKDVAVALSVVGYAFQALVLRLANERPFPDAIARFVQSLVRAPAEDVSVAETKAWCAQRFGSANLRVLDFGSGNSSRTVALLESLGLTRQRIALDRFDLIPEWGNHGPTAQAPAGLCGVRFTDRHADAVQWAGDAQIVVASHSLYDPKAVRDLSRLMQKAKLGTVLLVRGGSPLSFLAPIVMYKLFSWMRPYYSAYWDSHALDYLRQTCSLRFATNGTPSSRPMVIGQHLVVRQDLLGSLEQAIEYQYGRTMALSIRRLVSIALERCPSDAGGQRSVSLNNPDLVYVLEKVTTNCAVEHAETSRATDDWSKLPLGGAEFGVRIPGGTTPTPAAQSAQPPG